MPPSNHRHLVAAALAAIGCGLAAAPAASAADLSWTGASAFSDLFDDPLNWSGGSGAPLDPVDTVFYDTGAAESTTWDAVTGALGITNSALTIDNASSVEFISLEPAAQPYSITGTVRIDRNSSLILDGIALEVASGNELEPAALRVGVEEAGFLTIESGTTVTADSMVIGEDSLDFGTLSQVSVSGNAGLMAGSLSVGRSGNPSGVTTAVLQVDNGGAADLGGLSVSERNRVTVIGPVSQLNAGGAVLAEGATLEFLNGATGTLNDATLNRNSSYTIADGANVSSGDVVSFGGSIDIRGGAMVDDIGNIASTTWTLLAGPGIPTGDTFIAIDGSNTAVTVDRNGGLGYTGVSLGWGGSTTMSVTGGAAVEVFDDGTGFSPGGFAVGQDIPDNVGQFLGSSEFDGPTFGSSSLTIDGAGSRLTVTGPNIQGNIGSSTVSNLFIESVLLPGTFPPGALNDPGGNGTLNVTGGGVLELVGTGDWSALVAADSVNGVAAINVDGPGSMLDAGRYLFLGANTQFELDGGSATLEVSNQAEVKAQSLLVGTNAQVNLGSGGQLLLGSGAGGSGSVTIGGTLSANGGGTSLTGAGTGISINVQAEGLLTVENGATIEGSGTDSSLNVLGTAEIRSGAQINNLYSITLGTPGGEPGDLTIDGAATVVNLDRQNAVNGTALFVGFGAPSSAVVSGGATVNIGDSGPADVLGGLLVGGNGPPLIFGPADENGQASLDVRGRNTQINISGENVGVAVGSGSGVLAVFSNPGFGIPPELLEDAGGSGALNISDGAGVFVNPLSGSSTTRTIVADSASARGHVSVSGPGSTFAAGQVFALGVDAAEQTAGQGTLDVWDGGHVITDRLVIGDSSTANLYSGSQLTVGELVSDPARFNFWGGTLNLTEQNLVVGGAGTLGDTLQLNSAQSINVSLATQIDSDGLLVVDNGALTSTHYDNSGELFLNSPLARLQGQTLDNAGVVRGDGRVEASLTNQASGEVRGNAGQRLRFSGAGNSNSGVIANSGGDIEFTQDLTNNADGIISGRGTFRAGGGLVNHGGIALSGGVTDLFGDINNLVGASILVSGNATVTFWDDLVHNGDEVRISAGSTAVFFGTVSGSSPYTGTGSSFFEGDLNPGNSPGTMTVDGDATLGSGNTLTIELGDGSQDALLVGGELTLGGILDIVLLNSFEPAAGSSWKIVEATGGLVGTFDETLLPTLAGIRFALAYGSNDLRLSASAVPLPAGVWLLLSGLGMLAARRRGRCALTPR